MYSLLPVILFIAAEGAAGFIEKGNNIKRTFIFGSLYFLTLMFLAAASIPGLTFNTSLGMPEAVLTIFIITVIASSTYNIFPKLLGNYIIPVTSGVLIYLMLFKNYEYLNQEIYIAFLIAFAVAFLSMKLKFLTTDGSLAQFILAVFIFGLGGIKWTVPIVVFFVSSSLISKLKSENKSIAENYFEKCGTRDYRQVLANGGIGGALVILNKLFPSELFFWVYVSSLAAVCADTWGTEIGTLFKTKTIDIVNLKLVDQGTSGGVSIPGMLGAVLGAFIIPLSSLSWGRTIYFLSIITVSGVWGSIIDSYIGALFQAQYGCKICGKITERKIHCNAETSLIKGFNRLGNDGVNFISSLLAGITVIFLKEIIRA